jgi:hypothetical protein
MDIPSISNNVLGEASQAVDSGVYLVPLVCTWCNAFGAQQWCISWKFWDSVLFS